MPTITTDNPWSIRAFRLLRHYFASLWAQAGVQWSSDNDAEIQDLIQSLVNAAKEELLKELT